MTKDLRSVLIGVLFGVLLAAMVFLAAPTAHAHHYTADDTHDAIYVASRDTGVSYSRLERIVSCETGGTFNPHAVGRLGERGVVQLYARGALRDFNAYYWSLGIVPDAFDPYQSVYFLAEALTGVHPGLGAWTWSCK